MSVRNKAPAFAVYLSDVAVAEARAEVARLEYHKACSAADTARETVEFCEREIITGTDDSAKHVFGVYRQIQADASEESEQFLKSARVWVTVAESVRNQVAAIFGCEAPELFDPFEPAE